MRRVSGKKKSADILLTGVATMDLRSIEEDLARMAPNDVLLLRSAAVKPAEQGDKTLGEARSLIEAVKGLDEKIAVRDAALSRTHQAVIELSTKASMSLPE